MYSFRYQIKTVKRPWEAGLFDIELAIVRKEMLRFQAGDQAYADARKAQIERRVVEEIKSQRQVEKARRTMELNSRRFFEFGPEDILLSYGFKEVSSD